MSSRVEEIVQFTSDAILSLDGSGNIVLFNPAAERLFGYSEVEVIGQNLDMLLPERIKQDHPGYIEAFWKSSETARQMADRMPVSGIMKDGTEKDMDVSIQKHPEGSHYCYTAICRDISRAVSVSRDLAESEARLARAQAIAHLGNWEWNITTGALAWSDEIYRIFGRQPQEFEPTYERFLGTIHEDDRARVSDAVNDAVENAAPYSVVHRIVCPDGTEKVVQEMGNVLRDKDGAGIRMDGTVQEITRIWEIGEALSEATRAARQAERTKSQFMNIMSHELRTPISAILGLASLLEIQLGQTAEGSADQQSHKFTSEITRNGEHLLGLIDDVLQFSSLEANPSSCSRSHFNARALVTQTVESIQSDLDKSNLKVKVDIPVDLPDLYLDHIQCRQILLNLLSNAVKFSSADGSITISVESSDGEIRLSVVDEGIGMSEREITSIFTPFAQGNMELSRPYEGIGLGLAIVQTLAGLHGGKVTVESRPKHGSTFTIHFPIVEHAVAFQAGNS